MNEPRSTLLCTHHLDVTMEPDGVSIPGEDPIDGSQRFTREHHLGGLKVPTLLIIRVNLAIPSDRIVEPLILRKSKRGLYIGTDIGLADSSIEKNHEDHRRNLFNQGMISGFNVWQRSMILLDGLTAVFEWFGIRLEKDTGESLDDAFRFLQTQWSLSSFAHASTS